VCRHKCALTNLLPLPQSDRVMSQRAFHTCAENELAALYYRHLIATPTISDDAYGAFRFARAWCRKWMGEVLPWSASQVLATRTGALLRRYQEAFLSLETRPVDGDDMKVKMFVKVEKSDNDQFDKAPRAIQYRNTRYTAELARYLMPIDKIVFRRSPTSPFVKGLNSFERAKRMRALDRWSDTVYLSIDHSKFDAHVSAHWLRAEHQFYLTLCPDPALAKLLAAQLVNQARTQNGIVYTSDGGRMSGEFNTSLGNNLINYAIIMTICEPLGTILVDFDFVQDGDDFVIACRESSIAKLGSIPDRCLKLGMTTKVSNPVRHLEQVEFCQSQCLAVGDVGHRMVRFRSPLFYHDHRPCHWRCRPRRWRTKGTK